MPGRFAVVRDHRAVVIHQAEIHAENGAALLALEHEALGVGQRLVLR